MKAKANIEELIKTHIASIDSDAEVIILPLGAKPTNEELQVYVLLAAKFDLKTERDYENARYQVEMKSGQSLALYIYTKADWHKQFKSTPIYKRVQSEGILLYAPKKSKEKIDN